MILIHKNILYWFLGPWWQSGNTLASHLWGWGSIPVTASSGKAGSCLPLVSSLQYRTLTNYMYWFPLPFQLPIVIWPVQCWKRRKTPNKKKNKKIYRFHPILFISLLPLSICLTKYTGYILPYIINLQDLMYCMHCFRKSWLYFLSWFIKDGNTTV